MRSLKNSFLSFLILQNVQALKRYMTILYSASNICLLSMVIVTEFVSFVQFFFFF